MEELSETYLPLLKQYWLPLGLSLFGLIFFAYGLISLFNPQQPSDIVFSTSEKEEPALEIMVDVEGAVLKPGVYKIKPEARIQDALIAAKGLSQDADRDWVAKNVNLASKLQDGMKIYVPALGERVFSQAEVSSGGPAGTGSININLASSGELDKLPGVGPVTAEKIINGRPYLSIEDVKRSVGNSVFEKIKDKISL